MNLCSYIVRYDSGFAPNPFWGYCTLAACTPNHMGIRLEPGDWIVGHAGKRKPNHLVYAMKVEEILDFDEYFRDPRFQRKKPKRGSAQRKEWCGDNIYYIDATGRWRQSWTRIHTEAHLIRQDLKYHRVFVGTDFFYFGDAAPEVSSRFRDLLWDRHGCKKTFPAYLVEAFVEWLRATYSPGCHGTPEQWPKGSGRACH